MPGSDPPCLVQPNRERCHAGNRLQRVLWRDEPPHLVELEALQGEQAQMQMSAMGRVERTTQQADAAMPARSRPALTRGGQGRSRPLPRTKYLEVVSSAAPTGPRGGRRWVELPISAPMPNSPPSANWVEALTSTMALSTSRRKRSATAVSSVTIASVWCEP